jgi:hypothetical protein
MHRMMRFVAGSAFVAAIVAVLVAASSAVGRSQAKPANTKPPAIGAPYSVEVGTTLTGGQGTWTGTAPITYRYYWFRCDANGASCTKISGATTTTYKVASADVGHTIRFQVTAENSDGETSASSDPTNQIPTKANAPLETAPPTISGSAVVGETLTATTGKWLGTQPVSYAFDWQSCNVGMTACHNNGASGNTYTVKVSDNGSRIRVTVLATNSAGESVGLSDPTDVVKSTGGTTTTTTTPPSGGSIDASQVPKDQRLVVEKVSFNPNPVTSRNQQITVKITVEDTQGHLVRNALVFFRSTPLVTSTPTDAPTGDNGVVTYRITPQSDFPIKNGYSVQFYAKAYRKGDPTLGGIYGSRLVQVATRTP